MTLIAQPSPKTTIGSGFVKFDTGELYIYAGGGAFDVNRTLVDARNYFPSTYYHNGNFSPSSKRYEFACIASLYNDVDNTLLQVVVGDANSGFHPTAHISNDLGKTYVQRSMRPDGAENLVGTSGGKLFYHGGVWVYAANRATTPVVISRNGGITWESTGVLSGYTAMAQCIEFANNKLYVFASNLASVNYWDLLDPSINGVINLPIAGGSQNSASLSVANNDLFLTTSNLGGYVLKSGSSEFVALSSAAAIPLSRAGVIVQYIDSEQAYVMLGSRVASALNFCVSLDGINWASVFEVSNSSLSDNSGLGFQRLKDGRISFLLCCAQLYGVLTLNKLTTLRLIYEERVNQAVYMALSALSAYGAWVGGTTASSAVTYLTYGSVKSQKFKLHVLENSLNEVFLCNSESYDTGRLDQVRMIGGLFTGNDSVFFANGFTAPILRYSETTSFYPYIRLQ